MHVGDRIKLSSGGMAFGTLRLPVVVMCETVCHAVLIDGKPSIGSSWRIV